MGRWQPIRLVGTLTMPLVLTSGTLQMAIFQRPGAVLSVGLAPNRSSFWTIPAQRRSRVAGHCSRRGFLQPHCVARLFAVTCIAPKAATFVLLTASSWHEKPGDVHLVSGRRQGESSL